MLSGLIARTKVRYMNHMLRKQIYAGLFEIIKDEKMYYHSAIGKDYSHFNEAGKEEVIKWMELMAWEMIKLENQELDIRAKKLVWEEIKK